jgi:hypothetical protein
MKNYSSNRAQKGKTAFRTPSRWIKTRPEIFKRLPNSKLHRANKYSGISLLK